MAAYTEIVWERHLKKGEWEGVYRLFGHTLGVMVNMDVPYPARVHVWSQEQTKWELITSLSREESASAQHGDPLRFLLNDVTEEQYHKDRDTLLAYAKAVLFPS
jgi:hypothetical protein